MKPADPTPPLWQGGWYTPARALASPNFGPRPEHACIDLIVLHSISLPPGQYGGDEVQRLFTNRLDWMSTPTSVRSAAWKCRRTSTSDAMASCGNSSIAISGPGMPDARIIEAGTTATTTR